MAATEGSVAEFSSFANFEERKRKSNLPFGVIFENSSRKHPLFRFCRPILDIFGLTLLNLTGLVKVNLNIISTRRVLLRETRSSSNKNVTLFVLKNVKKKTTYQKCFSSAQREYGTL